MKEIRLTYRRGTEYGCFEAVLKELRKKEITVEKAHLLSLFSLYYLDSAIIIFAVCKVEGHFVGILIIIKDNIVIFVDPEPFYCSIVEPYLTTFSY